MNIVVIADGHPREWPILEAISFKFPDAVWIHPIYSTPDTLASIHSKKEKLTDRLSREYRHFRDRIRRRVMKIKAGEANFSFRDKIEIPWLELDREKGLELIEKLQTDVILACRAPILKAELIKKAKWCGINIHFGLVPDYRGNEGLFWAILNKDFAAMGGSIHLLDAGVDTGPIIAEAYPKLDGNESLASIELKVSCSLATALIDCLNQISHLKRAPRGIIQDRKGRNFLSKERTIFKDVAFYLTKFYRIMPVQEERLTYFIDGERTSVQHPSSGRE